MCSSIRTLFSQATTGVEVRRDRGRKERDIVDGRLNVRATKDDLSLQMIPAKRDTAVMP